MFNSMQNAGLFLVNTLFELYLLILGVRFLLAWARADYFNPITRFIIQCTQPIIGPLRRVIPNFKNIELSTFITIFVFEIIKFLLIGWITSQMFSIAGLFILSAAEELKLLLNILFYSIIIQAILSWVQQGYSPVAVVLKQLTSPFMRPIQRVIPPIGGVDISPIFALIFLQLLIILLVGPLFSFGMEMAISR